MRCSICLLTELGGFFFSSLSLDMMKTGKEGIPSLPSQRRPAIYALLSCHLSSQPAVNPLRQEEASLYFLIQNLVKTRAEKSHLSQ